MNINRNNYEEFFMLYADNELSAADRKEVEAFADANVDLKSELASFSEYKLRPDTSVVFDNKASLLKQEGNAIGITTENCESFFVLYADNELTSEQKAVVREFVARNPLVQPSFRLLQEVKLQADQNIQFQNKASLYRHEEDDKVIPFTWWRMAVAAAAILFVAGFFWMSNGKKIDTTEVAQGIKKVQPVKTLPATNVKDTITEKINTVQQETKNNVAVAVTKDNNTEKNNGKTEVIVANTIKKIKNKNSNLPVTPDVTLKNDDVAANKPAVINVTPALKKTNEVEPERPLVAAAKINLPDQPAVLKAVDENQTKAEFASLNTDNIEVLNTSVNTKNSLRGFLRKASRMIARKTNSDNDAGNQKKGILIGGFEIAVR